MPDPIKFRLYCKHLWDNYLHKARPWARDQIGWPLVMVVVTPLAAAAIIHRKIDWQLFWTSIALYALAGFVYISVHFIKAGWHAYSQKHNDYVLLTDALHERTQVMLQAQREATAARSEIISHLNMNEHLGDRLEEAEKAIKERDEAIDELTAVENAPELLIEYDHSEQVTWSQQPPSSDHPIIVKNISNGKNAFNVAIKPLETEDGVANFLPMVITCIKSGEHAEFNAKVDGANKFLKNQLLHLLRLSYKEGVPGYDIQRDLFGTRSFTITIEYTNTAEQKYEAECEITYRAWKNVIRPGKHRIKRVS